MHTHAVHLYLVCVDTRTLLCQIPDQDLQRRRIGQKVDPLSNEVFIKSLYDPKPHTEGKKEDREEGEDEEGEEEEKDEADEEEGEGSKENKSDEFQDDLVSLCDLMRENT